MEPIVLYSSRSVVGLFLVLYFYCREKKLALNVFIDAVYLLVCLPSVQLVSRSHLSLHFTFRFISCSLCPNTLLFPSNIFICFFFSCRSLFLFFSIIDKYFRVFFGVWRSLKYTFEHLYLNSYFFFIRAGVKVRQVTQSNALLNSMSEKNSDNGRIQYF